MISTGSRALLVNRPCILLPCALIPLRTCRAVINSYGCSMISTSLSISITTGKSAAISRLAGSSLTLKSKLTNCANNSTACKQMQSVPVSTQCCSSLVGGGNACFRKVRSRLSITTIIVNYNAGALLQRCVQALVQSTQHSRIVVVDNASSDKSAQN